MLPKKRTDQSKSNSPTRYVTTLWLVMSIALLAVTIGFVAAELREGYSEHGEFLQYMVDSEVRIFQSILQSEGGMGTDITEETAARTLSYLHEAHSNAVDFGPTGEHVFGEMVGNTINIYGKSTEARIPVGSGLAIPMQRALAGQSGTIIARDYNGTLVYAAYAPVPNTNVAFVAKMDVSEVIGVETRAFAPAVLLALLVLMTVTRVFAGNINKIVNTFHDDAVRFERAERIGNFAYWFSRVNDDEMTVSENMENILPQLVRGGKMSRTEYFSFIHPEDLEWVRAAFADALESAGELDYIHRVIDLPGDKVRYLRIQADFGSESVEKSDLVEGMLQDVTESEKLNTRLEAQRRKHFERLTYLEVGFVIYNPDSTLRFVNEKAQEMFHLSEVNVGAQGCEDPIWQFKHEDGRSMKPSEYPVSKLIGEGGRIQNKLIRYPDESGSRNRWLFWSGYVEYTEENGAQQRSVPESVIITYTDVSETVSAREGLESSNALLRERVIQQESVRSIQEILDDCPNVRQVIPEVAESLDKGLGQTSSLTATIIVDDMAYGGNITSRDESIHTIGIRPDGQHQGELRLCSPVGERPRTEFSIENAIGFCELVASIVENAFEKEETVRRLTLLNASLQSTIEGVLITDSDGTIEWVNPAIESITGYTKDELIGRNPRTLKSGRQSKEFYEQMWGQISAGQPWRGEFVNRKKSGDYYNAQISITPIIDDTGAITHYIGVHDDITEIRDTERQLRQAQKLESLGTLAGGIAHDFNNILSSIIGFADLARGELDEDSQAHKDIGEVLKAGDKARTLIRQILTFTRGEESESVPLYPHLVINEAMKLLEQGIPNSVEFETNLEKIDSVVHMDPTRLHQLIMNLVTNAFQALPTEKGHVSVSLSEVHLTKPVYGVTTTIHPGLFAELVVSDDGAGIPEALMRKIFDPFFTTKDVGKGTGLGLSTVIGIVEQAKGAIKVESAEGQGTTFTVYLPAYLQDQEKDSNKVFDLIRGNGEHIAIIDDREEICELHRRIVESLGYTATTFTSSRSALDTITQNARAYDLILTDYTMPEISGLELASEVAKIRPELPIVICTGRTDLVNKTESALSKEIPVISKPLGVDILSKTLHRLISNNFEGGS